MAKKETLLSKFTRFISWLVGSWIGVLLHMLWFGIWLYYNFSIDLLTLSVSLEAIFIGIFLLMASNEAEAARDAKERRERMKDRHVLKEDVSLDEIELNYIKELRKEIRALHEKIDALQSKKS